MCEPAAPHSVMPGLGPGIHAFFSYKGVDRRTKAGDDGVSAPSLTRGGREMLGEIRVRARDDVDRDHRADAVRGLAAGFGRGLHRTDIAVDDDGDQAVAHFLAADDGHVRRLHHGIRRRERRDETLGLDHSDCIRHGPSPLLGSFEFKNYLRAAAFGACWSSEPMMRASIGILPPPSQAAAVEPVTTITSSPSPQPRTSKAMMRLPPAISTSRNAPEGMCSMR